MISFQCWDLSTQHMNSFFHTYYQAVLSDESLILHIESGQLKIHIYSMRYMWLTLACPRNISCNFGTSGSKLKKIYFLLHCTKIHFPHLTMFHIQAIKVLNKLGLSASGFQTSIPCYIKSAVHDKKKILNFTFLVFWLPLGSTLKLSTQNHSDDNSP